MSGLRTPSENGPYLALKRARSALLGGDDPKTDRRATMFDDDVVSFAHGEGVRRPYPGAIAAMVRALADPAGMPLENYMFLRRFPDLEKAISKEMNAIGVPDTFAKNIVLDAGTTRLIVAALDLMTRPGDTVVTFSGFYHPLASWCAYRGLNLQVVPTSSAEGHRPSAAMLELALAEISTPTPPVLILFNPSMTGALCTRSEIEEISEVVDRRKMWVIEDALFANCEFAEGARSARLAATPVAERVLTVAGASKLHGLANMRIGWGCGAMALTDALREYVTASAASIPHLAKVAALASLHAPSDYISRNVCEVRTRLDLVATIIGEMDMRLRAVAGESAPLLRVSHVPQAGHSILIDFEGFVEAVRMRSLSFFDSADLTRWFLKVCAVAFSPAQSHGFGGFQLRMNVASVGTSSTYPASLSAERAWDGAWSQEHAAAFEPGFAEGRRVIVSAMTERVEPAMRRALVDNIVQQSYRAATGRPRSVRGLEEAVEGCDAVLMDVWGVLTDGARLFDDTLMTLQRLAEVGRPVVLVSNTSRRSHDLAKKLAALGIPRDTYTSIVTGGELAYRCAAMRRVGERAFGERVFLLGEQPDGHWAEEAGLVPVEEVDEADLLLGVGVLNGQSADDGRFRTLRRAAGRCLPFLVSNADVTVHLGGQTYVGVGALATHYRSLGGETHIFGKPHHLIFAEALAHAATRLGRDTVEPDRVLAVGDSLVTDIAGAAALGMRTLLVTATGVHTPDLYCGGSGPLCADALARLCDEHGTRPDLTLGGIAW